MHELTIIVKLEIEERLKKSHVRVKDRFKKSWAGVWRPPYKVL